jgi:hypothetical protein
LYFVEIQESTEQQQQNHTHRNKHQRPGRVSTKHRPAKSLHYTGHWVEEVQRTRPFWQLLRRTDARSTSGDQDLNGLIINREEYQVTLNGERVHLPKKEFELLELLASKPGSVFERDTILETVWGSDIIVGDRTIDVHVRKLREKLGDGLIKTVKGVGYKLEV